MPTVKGLLLGQAPVHISLIGDFLQTTELRQVHDER
jgi:hypothetical protein